uniref:Uncharacterized protein n=1 Tax=Arundo donax TaxID=35708 RepID=A0A0A8Y5Q8_ARUDO
MVEGVVFLSSMLLFFLLLFGLSLKVASKMTLVLLVQIGWVYSFFPAICGAY